MIPWSQPEARPLDDVRAVIERYVESACRLGRLEEEALLRQAIVASDWRRIDRIHLVAGSWADPAASVASMWDLRCYAS